jgi:hypothetical protein
MSIMRHPVTNAMISYWSWFDMEYYPSLSRWIFGLKPETAAMDLATMLGPRFGKSTPYEIRGPGNIRVEKTGIHISFASHLGDQVEFDLDRGGRHCVQSVCEPLFQPIIEVAATNGLIYFIDLREFFFISLGHSTIPQLNEIGSENLKPDQVLAITYDNMIADLSRPRIHYRRKRLSPELSMTTEQGLKQTIQG